MARYHAWASARLLSSIEQVPEDKYRQDCGLFFGSIHGTLNHLLLTDGEIWMPRLTGEEITKQALDAEIETDRTVLAERLTATTSRWPQIVDGLSEAALAGPLNYTMTTGEKRSLPMPAAILHAFNHATHHRGQITAAISMMGFEFQSIDLPLLIFAEQSA